MAQTTDGKEIFLQETNISSEGIEKIINDKRGGKREGAGSKRKIGYSIPTIRILARIKENIQCYIDVYSHYYKDDEIPYQ